MNIFIWANSVGDSNNNLIAETIKKEHEAKGDNVYTLIAEKAEYTETSIKNYQDELKKADFVYLAYPIQWGSYPNLFKKTLDSVLAYGFAYEKTAEGGIKQLLTGKKGKVVTTSGHPNEYYVEQIKAIHYLAGNTILGFTGIESVGAINLGGRTHGNTEGFSMEELKGFVNN